MPNNTAGETFLHKSGAVWSANWKFIIGATGLAVTGEYMILGKSFTMFVIFKHEVVAGQLLPGFLPYRILRGGLC